MYSEQDNHWDRCVQSVMGTWIQGGASLSQEGLRGGPGLVKSAFGYKEQKAGPAVSSALNTRILKVGNLGLAWQLNSIIKDLGTFISPLRRA